jgi:glycine oxidase
MVEPVHASGLRVVIVGGGIIGCLTAWRLRLLDAEPLVLERGQIGAESSWAGAGILSPIQPWLYPDAFSDLVNASLALYPEFVHELEDIAAMSVEWCRSGLMVPVFASDRVDHRPAALAWSERFGWRLEQLSAGDTRRHEPAISPEVAGSLLWPEVGQVRNPRLLQAGLRAMQALGVQVREHVEVAGLIERQGEVTGVRLASGEEVAADAVLLAAGSWSGGLSEAMGLSLPVRPVKGQIVLLHCEPGTVRHIVKHDDAYFVPRLDGRVLVGASLEDAGFRRGNTVAEVGRLLDAVRTMMPALGEAEIEQQWMGFRPGSPDGLPYLGPVAGHRNLWVSTGHYRNGVVLAPISAELIARWIMGQAPSLPMDAFSPERAVLNQPQIGYPQRA